MDYSEFLFKVADFQGSAAQADAVLRAQPGNPAAHLQRALALGRLGRYSDALPVLEQGLQANPRAVELRILHTKLTGEALVHDTINWVQSLPEGSGAAEAERSLRTRIERWRPESIRNIEQRRNALSALSRTAPDERARRNAHLALLMLESAQQSLWGLRGCPAVPERCLHLAHFIAESEGRATFPDGRYQPARDLLEAFGCPTRPSLSRPGPAGAARWPAPPGRSGSKRIRRARWNSSLAAARWLLVAASSPSCLMARKSMAACAWPSC
ncbi:MAG: tetratricopeptide repeat protein [Rubrivivax sp.]